MLQVLLKLCNASWQKLQVNVVLKELMLQDDMADGLGIGSLMHKLRPLLPSLTMDILAVTQRLPVTIFWVGPGLQALWTSM